MKKKTIFVQKSPFLLIKLFLQVKIFFILKICVKNKV